jgi:hypothetical protein
MPRLKSSAEAGDLGAEVVVGAPYLNGRGVRALDLDDRRGCGRGRELKRPPRLIPRHSPRAAREGRPLARLGRPDSRAGWQGFFQL